MKTLDGPGQMMDSLNRLVDSGTVCLDQQRLPEFVIPKRSEGSAVKKADSFLRFRSGSE
jgi:hypothetical protein